MSGRALCNLVWSFLDEDARETLAGVDPVVQRERRLAAVIAAGAEIG